MLRPETNPIVQNGLIHEANTKAIADSCIKDNEEIVIPVKHTTESKMGILR